MSAKDVIEDEKCCPSVLWEALEVMFGPTVGAWEVETLYLELRRKGFDTTPSLMAKVLATQTIKTTYTWSYDYDVLFAFALACDGIPASSTSLHHPEPVQLCWAVKEIEALIGIKITEDQGFDPDAVDPAVAALLLDDGFSNAPDALEFADDVLERMAPHNKDLRSKVKEKWSDLRTSTSETLRRTIEAEPATPVDVQLASLAECELHVRGREALRAQQHARLDPGV